LYTIYDHYIYYAATNDNKNKYKVANLYFAPHINSVKNSSIQGTLYLTSCDRGINSEGVKVDKVSVVNITKLMNTVTFALRNLTFSEISFPQGEKEYNYDKYKVQQKNLGVFSIYSASSCKGTLFGGSNDKYFNKYMKYKTKYLRIKNLK
jgi:hypothetical protein